MIEIYYNLLLKFFIVIIYRLCENYNLNLFLCFFNEQQCDYGEDEIGDPYS